MSLLFIFYVNYMGWIEIYILIFSIRCTEKLGNSTVSSKVLLDKDTESSSTRYCGLFFAKIIVPWSFISYD